MTRSVVQVHISPPGDDGVIAQLIRALPLQGRGPGFESLLLHHFFVFCDIIYLWILLSILDGWPGGW